MNDDFCPVRGKSLDRQIRYRLTFGNIAGSIPGNAATKLHSCHSNEIQIQRSKYGYDISRYIGRAENVTAEVEYNVVSSVWRAVLFRPGDRSRWYLELFQVLETAIICGVIDFDMI